MLLCVGLFSAGSIINGISANYWLFMAMRFVIGFGVIGMVTVAMVYMAEMLPSANRGRYQALSIAAGTIGIPTGALFANIAIQMFGEHGWRFCFFIGGASVFIIPIGIRWLKESPRWLVMNGRVKEAEKIVSTCTGEASDLSALAERYHQEKPVTTRETLKVITGPAFFRQTVVVTVLAWGATLGVFYMGTYGTQFNVELGWTYSIALMIGAVGVFGTPIGDLFVSFISDKGGRRIPIIIFAMFAALSCIIGGLAMPPLAKVYVATSATWCLVVAALLGITRSVFCGGMMTLMWTYLAESFPNRVRSNATGLVFGSARLIAVPVTLTVPFTYALVGYVGVNFVNALWYIVPALFALFWGRSSAKKSLEQLEREAQMSI
jgi:putative MFS transporter